MSPPATLLMWFQLRSPELAEDFERLMAEIVEVERWEQQASELLQRLADDLAHLVSNRGLLVLRPAL